MQSAAAAALLFYVFSAILAPPVAADAADGGFVAPVMTLERADNLLDVAERMLEGGIYDRTRSLTAEVLDDPAASAVAGTPEEIQEWLRRRERARFFYERARFGLATTRSEFLDVAESLVQLTNNRYRLFDPAYAVQSAYWSGRAYESADEYQDAVDMYARVGGVSLPAGMEGDAAQRTSRNLRMIAELIPFPGSRSERQRRDVLLNQAIGELDRARLAFPIGNRRKEIELDLIALRLARREEQFVREAATEAEALIERDPARDSLRARAALYRGRAAALLGDSPAASQWYRRVIENESPTPEDRREAELGLSLALVEMSGSQDPDGKRNLLSSAADSLAAALAGADDSSRWDGARLILADTQLKLDRPTAALETLRPILASGRPSHTAWSTAGMAELRRGRLSEAFGYLYASSRPSNPSSGSRFSASQGAAATADARRDFGRALALTHQASRMLRGSLLFSSLLVSEYRAMEIILRLGKLGGPVSLSADADLLRTEADDVVVDIATTRQEAADRLAASLGRLLSSGGSTDASYDLAIDAGAMYELDGDPLVKLELAIGMIRHLRVRQPTGVADSVLSSRLGDARQALALARAEKVLSGDEPDVEEIDRTLGDFAAAAQNFQAASAGGMSFRDSLDQGVVNMESGGFLLRLADRWNHGRWSGQALSWREEARQRIEASLRPFNRTIAASGSSSLTARRARWSRGRALEMLGEWRGAAQDYLSLMNNSEMPRVLRTNAARRWAECLHAAGETRQAMIRLAAFADADAESALLEGKLAESAGFKREAYERFRFAADPGAPYLPPATPYRSQEAAFRAAALAMEAPTEINPLEPAEATVGAAREALVQVALAEIGGRWAIPILNLIGDSLIKEPPDGWRQAYLVAMQAMEVPGVSREDERAMRVLAARAMSAGDNQEEALNQLDEARELLDDSPQSRRDAAHITLENARIYRRQGRAEEALRAYADVFAVYPDAMQTAEEARVEAATMILNRPDLDDRSRDQARNILNGLRDQNTAERLMVEYGIR